MTPEDHYKKAESILNWFTQNETHPMAELYLQKALVHAQLGRAKVTYERE